MNPFRGSFIRRGWINSNLFLGIDPIPLNKRTTERVHFPIIFIWDLNDWILRVASSYFLAF